MKTAASAKPPMPTTLLRILMKTNCFSLLLLCGCLAAPAAIAADQPAKPDSWQPTLVPVDEPLTTIGRNPCFILEPGYQLTLAGKEGGKPVDLVITVLNETLDIGGVPTRIVEERESVDGKLVEVSRNYFALGTQTKNLYYFGEDVDIYRDGKITSHEGAWREGQNGARRGILLPGTLKVGDRYYQEQAPGAAMDRAEHVSVTETVKTPAATFRNCLKTKETTPLEPGMEYKFYVSGIGLVRDANLKLVKHGFAK